METSTGQWFAGRKKTLHLYGTSIGSWKSAAAARQNPKAAFDSLAQAYIHQHYQGRITPDQVAVEAERILHTFVGPGVPEEVLQHPYCRLHLSAVRCRGPLASYNPKIEMFGLAIAWLANRISRNLFHYHPAFDFLGGEDGIVLYPHFYSQVTLGWFDKNVPG